LFEKLAGVGGEAFDIFALALGIERVKREAGFSRPAQAGNHRQLIARDAHVNVLEVVLPRTNNCDPFSAHFPIFPDLGKKTRRFHKRKWKVD